MKARRAKSSGIAKSNQRLLRAIKGFEFADHSATAGKRRPSTQQSEKGMNTPWKINQAYSAWFNQLISDRLSETGPDGRCPDPLNGYFVTITFDQYGNDRRRRVAAGHPLGTYEMDAFDVLYNMVCRKLIGRNYNRECNASRLPFALSFLDAEGSKFWCSTGDMTNLHIHSVWLVPSNKSDDFKALLGAPTGHGTMKTLLLGIDAIDVRLVGLDTPKAVERVTSYASKLIGFEHEELPLSQSFKIYPT
jgi:hypothetical protein